MVSGETGFASPSAMPVFPSVAQPEFSPLGAPAAPAWGGGIVPWGPCGPPSLGRGGLLGTQAAEQGWPGLRGEAVPWQPGTRALELESLGRKPTSPVN